MRGSSSEFSSSAQTPAPVAVCYQYYELGELDGAVGFHLSLMNNRARMIKEKPKVCQCFSPRGSPRQRLPVAREQRGPVGGLTSARVHTAVSSYDGPSGNL